MIALPYDRVRTTRWAWRLLVVAAVVWYPREYRPRDAAVRLRTEAVEAREARIRAARAAAVIHGQAGLDSLLERFRADSVRLVTRIPPAADAPAVAAEVKDALGHLERRTGVRITGTAPLPPRREGPIETGGYRVSVVGRYEQIGDLTTELASLQRLTGIRDLRLHAIPDSLLRTVTPFGGDPAPAALAPADSGVARALADAGEPPFQAAAIFSVVWFTLPASDAAGPAEASGQADTSLLRGAR